MNLIINNNIWQVLRLSSRLNSNQMKFPYLVMRRVSLSQEILASVAHSTCTNASVHFVHVHFG